MVGKQAKLAQKPDLPAADEDECAICSPLPASTGPMEVTVFPMKKVAKAQREESSAVLVVKWEPQDDEDDEPRWLFVKRPEEGGSGHRNVGLVMSKLITDVSTRKRFAGWTL